MNDKLRSVARGAVIAGVGALLASLAENLGSIPLGPYAPFVAAALSIAVNAIRKLAS